MDKGTKLIITPVRASMRIHDMDRGTWFLDDNDDLCLRATHGWVVIARGLYWGLNAARNQLKGRPIAKITITIE